MTAAVQAPAAAVVLLLLPAYLILVAMPVLVRLQRLHGWTAPNYLGQAIPVGTGLALFLAVLAAALALPLLGSAPGADHEAAILFMGVVAMTGWIDDRWGSSEPRGLTGHLGALMQRRLTTGQLKLAVGTSGAVAVTWWLEPGASPAVLLVTALLLAGSTNLINLLDLRPGRGLKGFWLLAFFLALVAALPHWFWGLMLATLVYAPWDLGGRAMLGDAGAGLLGAAWGMAAVWALAPGLRVAAAVLVVWLHLLAERRSLNRVIKGLRLLRFVDRLGRAHPGESGAAAGADGRGMAGNTTHSI